MTDIASMAASLTRARFSFIEGVAISWAAKSILDGNYLAALVGVAIVATLTIAVRAYLMENQNG